jgi:L-cysteine:1D-myo-inositol 2-amino-2-deoxy-alpha-D-glucopyranoside ligase
MTAKLGSRISSKFERNLKYDIIMKLYDTAQQKPVDFAPNHQVNLYVCGITPYDAAHLGHIFTFLQYDLLQRRLEDFGHDVRLVRNITDVDDPIYERAKQNGEPYTELAERETGKFQEVMRQLNFREPYAEPRASEYILPMAKAVETLLASGQAYKIDEDIYFDVSKFPSFGQFSQLPANLQLAFMRQRGGDPGRPGKRQPLDFLLWKNVGDPSDPAAWDTDLGRGRPGWHLECSIMSSDILGTPLDLHGGGMDLIFPHHECEIAQSESLGASPFAKHWLHVAPLGHQSEKMSKSLGNLVFASDLLAHYHPDTIRLALLNYHYRQGGEWQASLLAEAEELRQKLAAASRKDSGQASEQQLAAIRAALDNNLNTPAILGQLHNLAASILNNPAPKPITKRNTPLRNTCRLLGLDFSN